MAHRGFYRRVNQEDRTYIYALLDPLNSVFYIGHSSKPKERLDQHIREAKKGGGPPRCQRIRDILRDEKQPRIEILQETIRKEAVEIEKQWISWAVGQGYDLMNMDFCSLNRRPEYGKKRERR